MSMKSKILHWPDKFTAEKWSLEFAGDINRPCLILLNGEMGAGKTQIVRWVLSQLGVKSVASPTFAIHHQYQIHAGSIEHFDLYRLKTLDDLESSGFWDVIGDPLGLVFVEWADRLSEDAWPKDRRWIRIDIVKREGDARDVTVTVQEP